MTALPTLAFARQSRFTREPFAEIEPRGEEWRIYPVLPAHGLAFLVGPSKSFKSFWASSCGLHLAAGIDFMDSEVEQCGVAYVGAEGANGLRKRVKAWRTRFAFANRAAPFELIPQAPNLREDEDISDLTATLRDVASGMSAKGHPLGVVIIDTLAASMAGGDENNSSDMGRVVGRLQEMATELGVLVLCVAHTGKDETRGIRGWSGQYAGADAVLTCVRNPDDPKQALVTVDKLKDGEDGGRFAFRLEKVHLGADARGREITSAIPIFEEAPDGAARSRRAKLTPHAMKVQAAYGRLIDEGRGLCCPNVPGAPSGLVAVTETALRQQAFEMGMGGPEPDDTATRKKWLNNRATFFRRGLEHLEGARLFRSERGHVWELRQ